MLPEKCLGMDKTTDLGKALLPAHCRDALQALTILSIQLQGPPGRESEMNEKEGKRVR